VLNLNYIIMASACTSSLEMQGSTSNINLTYRTIGKAKKCSVCSLLTKSALHCCANFSSNLKLNYSTGYTIMSKKNAFSQIHFHWALIAFEENDEFIIRELSSYRCATSEGQQVNSFILCHSLTKNSKCQEELNFFFEALVHYLAV